MEDELKENKPGSPGFEWRFAKIISYLFHPLFMPTYGFILVLFTKNYISTFIPLVIKLIIIAITFIFTFLLPAINALILLKMGKIKSLEMETTEERLIPYGSAALYYFALLYLFYNARFPTVFQIIILGASSAIILTLLINSKWKISAHTAGIGGVIGAVLGIMYRLQINMDFVLFIVILIAGLIGYARLKLNAHSPSQVYCGLLLGFIIQLGFILLY